jgi:predicted P-loop ATPase
MTQTAKIKRPAGTGRPKSERLAKTNVQLQSSTVTTIGPRPWNDFLDGLKQAIAAQPKIEGPEDPHYENAHYWRAFSYAVKGWPVFPLAPRTKVPCEGTNGFKNATADVKQILEREWWRKKYPKANIGIATGHAFFALDVDTRHGGPETLESLIRKHGALPDTIQQITPTGGRHYLFAMPGFEVRNSQGKLGTTDTPGIDIRGLGGYIMAAPSIHPDAGTDYDWDGMDGASGELLPAPAWLLDMLKGDQTQRKGISEVPKIIPHGTQHSTLLSIGGKMRRDGHDEQAIYAALSVVNNTRCEIPGPDKNIRRLAASLAKYPPGQERYYVTEDPSEKIEGDPNWRERLSGASEGKAPINEVRNVIVALSQAPELAGGFAFNEFAQAPYTTRDLQCGIAGGSKLKDHDATAINTLLTELAGFKRLNTSLVREAVDYVARQRTMHPVREYLNSLEWDGIERLNHWLEHTFGCEEDAYTQAVGKRWLISAVARIMEPGCKADCVLILEGAQGIKKSTSAETLAGAWFTDELGDIGSKDAAINLAGVWIVELSELDGLSKADVSRIKAFASRSTDRYRPPYGRTAMDVPRQCIFIGTTNETEYLKDPTGGRRFWPVRCSQAKADIKWVEVFRDQLWAEAVAAYRRGEKWYMDTPELEALAREQQAERYDGDPWQEIIRRYCDTREDVSVDEILTGEWNAAILVSGIGKPPSHWTQADKIRVARCLTVLGYRKYQTSEPGRPRRYRREE